MELFEQVLTSTTHSITHKDFNVQTTVPTNRCQVAVIFWWTWVEERAKKEGMKETKAKKLRERERRD